MATATLIDGILTPWRLKWYPRMLLGAAAAAFVLVLCTGDGATISTGRLGGDFPEFYGAGRIVCEGRSSSLYDPDTQREAQRGLIPSNGPGEDNSFIPFAYPPHMALYYSLFARLPYKAAFILQTTLSTVFLFLAAWLSREAFPPASRHVLVVFAAMVFFYPLFRALLGGQNTPLSILCIAAAHVLSLRGRDLAAGVCLGLLLYKPQFGLPLLILYALGGRWRIFLGGIAVGLAFFLMDVVAFGPDWVGKWFVYARWVIKTSMDMESEKAVSLVGVFRNFSFRTGIDLVWVGYALAVSASGVLALVWMHSGTKGRKAIWEAGDQGASSVRAANASQGALLGLASAGVVLIAPHAYYYDTGLLFPAFMVFAQGNTPRI
jgi:hypothetical protein